MLSAAGRFVRGNAFLVAAVALPVLVAGFFILASAIPRWTVPAPAYDLVFRAARAHDASIQVAVEFSARDGRVEMTLRPTAPNSYTQPWGLLVFDHQTMSIREIPLELPDTLPDGKSTTIVVDALSGRRVTPETKAPDGYELRVGNTRGSGLVGDLFGMGRYRQNVALANNGRIVALELPAPYRNPYDSVYAVGWIVDERKH